MEKSQIYMAVIIIVLVIIAIHIFLLHRNKKTIMITPLTVLASGFVLLGIFLGEQRLLGYCIIGFGLFLSFIDLLIKYRDSKFRDN